MTTSRTPSLARLLVVSAIFYYLLGQALEYGAVWQSQAEPTPGVDVTLSDGKTVMTGTLWRAWSKEWVLETADGQQWHFQNYAVMRFRPPEQGGLVRDRSAWRSLLPGAVVVSVWFAWLLQGLGLPVLRRRAEG